jgi:coproporphyrinogen III oxidase-like Fe-S oxidoreductase
MGLRLTDGIEVARLEATGGRPLDQLLHAANLERFDADGLVQRRDGWILVTAAGRARLDGLLAALLP